LPNVARTNRERKRAGDLGPPVAKGYHAPVTTIAEIDALIAELEGAGRWRDVVSRLEERVELVQGGERIETLLRLMQLHRDRFNNQALAIGAAERILTLEPRHPQAVAYLRGAYARRRMHEHLAALERSLEDPTRGPYR
jgi:hypothetical protein